MEELTTVAQSRFECSPTSLDGVTIVERVVLDDSRGFFSRIFCQDELCHAGVRRPVVQINHTLTRAKGTVRGMHFQRPPHAETKLVSCLRGKVFDVAVDLRCDSPTFLKWHGEILSDANHKSLLIPEGFAHGFQSLTPNCELLYLHSAAYEPDAEGIVHALDPAIDIQWPLNVTEMSERDQSHRFLDAEFEGMRL